MKNALKLDEKIFKNMVDNCISVCYNATILKARIEKKYPFERAKRAAGWCKAVASRAEKYISGAAREKAAPGATVIS